MAKLAIKGHATRGKEVIGILEMLGGRIMYTYNGDDDTAIYFIDGLYIMAYKYEDINCEKYKIFTLEEFIEKFPYKVGDKVLYKTYGIYSKIKSMLWNEEKEQVFYRLESNKLFVATVDELNQYKEETLEVTEEFYNKHCVNCGSQRCTHNGEWLKECEHYKEETTNKAIFEGNAQSCDIMNNIIKENMKEIKIDIPKGYEFFGIDDDNKIVLAEKQPQYPKTYKECFNICFGNRHHIVQVVGLAGLGDNKELFESFIKLKICRDAYWKIAGEQMGLGKPWESDFTNNDEERYGIYTLANKVEKDFCGVGDVNMILVFPAEEMRDTFYENFKDLIEQCKELL